MRWLPCRRASRLLTLTRSRVAGGRGAAVAMTRLADDGVEEVAGRAQGRRMGLTPVRRLGAGRRAARDLALGIQRQAIGGLRPARVAGRGGGNRARELGGLRGLTGVLPPVAVAPQHRTGHHHDAGRGDLQIRAEEVAELVEAVDPPIREVEELHQILVSAALPKAPEQLVEASGPG